MKQIFIHNAFFRLLAPPIIGIQVYLLILLLNNSVEHIDQIFSGEEVYICIGLSFFFTEVFRLVVQMSERILSSTSTISRVTIQTMIHLVVTGMIISLGLWSYFYFALGFTPGKFEYQLFNGIFIIINMLFVLMYFSHYYMNKENKLKLEREKILKEGMEMELLDFKKDINPLLLYQSLEQLLILIHNNTDKAEEFIDSLSSVYRYILGSKQIELVSLEEELDVVDQLLIMFNEIYHDKVNFISPDSNLNTYLVPGTLVTLLDYIVRTTIITAQTPLTIVLHGDEDGYLTLQHENNERLISTNDNRQEILKVIERSYSIFSEKPVVNVKAHKECFFKVPILAMEEQPVVN